MKAAIEFWLATLVADPRDGAGNVEDPEAAVFHAANACDERRKRAHDGYETSENDGLAAVLLVKPLGLL